MARVSQSAIGGIAASATSAAAVLDRCAEAQVVHRHAHVVPRIDAADDDLREGLEEAVVRHPDEKQPHRGRAAAASQEEGAHDAA